MRQIVSFLLLLASGAALAGPNATDKLSQLNAELGGVRLEQQSVYQNYQMIQDLRRNEVQEASPPMAQHPYGMSIDTPPPNYDDVLRARLEREARIQQYTSDLRHLSKRYLKLEEEKTVLLRQIGDLEQHPVD